VCLIVLAVDQHPDYPLILAANRDEFHARPTENARWWPDRPDILGGRDLQAGGTWLAVDRQGRLATVTNFRDAKRPESNQRSRGHLVTDFLGGELGPHDYLDHVDEGAYAGFNLIVADDRDIAYLSNREDGKRNLAPGIYGLSNALLDGPWDKVERSKQRLTELLARGDISVASLLHLMDDRNRGPADEIERGRLDVDTAHAITAPFIVMPEYGTRCTTVVLAGEDGDWRFFERRFDASGRPAGESDIAFTVGNARAARS
jgi:uncharacterized protein with NRDE domain